MFVLEYADSGTLRDYLENNFNKLDWSDKLQFAIQIADAVTCIHRKNIVHRDLVSTFFFFNLYITTHMLIYLSLIMKSAF